MLKVRRFDYFTDSRERVQCVRCDGSADAILDAGMVQIGLCEECLDLVTAEMIELQGRLKRSCLHCKLWQWPNYDLKRYEGQCLLHKNGASYLESCNDFENC